MILNCNFSPFFLNIYTGLSILIKPINKVDKLKVEKKERKNNVENSIIEEREVYRLS